MIDPLRETLQASLGSTYTLTSELGGGGMSRVFVAREEALGRDVVVKVLSSEIAEGLSVERFGREIRLAAALQEPHIVPVLSAGVTTLGMPYYTMPFVRGASLRDRLAQGRLPAEDALGILRDVAQALAYAHAHGVVHRDIKPENILLSSGTAVVTDFGIAKALQVSRTVDADAEDGRGITRTGTSLGTPAYMAPEQAAGDPDTDQRADLYAWGVVAYELLAGQHPFASRTSPQQLLRAHLTEVPAPFAADIDVPPAIAALVRQCLEKNPDDRPASATALLQPLQAGRGRTTDAVKPARHTPRRVWVLGTLAAIAVVATGMWWRGTAGDIGDTTGAAAPVMMAVLPFEHAGPADQQPFTDGLTDAVTSKLASLSSLLVIDRRSAATYRGTTKPAQQIGRELGVRYLLEGVVRWAKDGAGTWRARVTPTLVDTKAGTITWTGTPVNVTLDDPFTAQGSIATDVAQAMEVAVLPVERVRIARRFTDNPQAFAAYQRAQEIINAVARTNNFTSAPANVEAIRELNTAIALDSTFAEAWGALARQHWVAAVNFFGDSVDIARSREVVNLALRRAPTEPSAILAAALWAWHVDRNRAAAQSLVTTALSMSRNDAGTLATASDLLVFWSPDSARTLAVRAAQLDPRSGRNLDRAARQSIMARRLVDARRFGEALVTLDSADTRGWSVLLSLQVVRGDTMAIQQLSARVMQNIRKPNFQLACWMSYGSTQLSAWYLNLPAGEQGLSSLIDSVSYYDCKTDAAVRVRGTAAGRAHSDSIIALLSPSRLSSLPAPPWSHELTILAYAYANVGKKSVAQALATRIVDEGQRMAGQDTLPLTFDSDGIASVYAASGDTASALRWLRVGLRQGYSVRWYKMNPRLRPLHATAAFERFVRENDR